MEDDGFLGFSSFFDTLTQRKQTTFSFPEPVGDIHLLSIGDDPGHVQSGQYVWPAASAAAHYLISNWVLYQSSTILELGAGCGLFGIAASRLPGVEKLIFTDYDYGSLQLISQNCELNSLSDFQVLNLQWGHRSLEIDSKISLIIGSDLIYSIDVIEPLFCTILHYLEINAGKFLLVSSFDIGSLLNDKLFNVCREFGFLSSEIQRLEPDKCRIQEFRLLERNTKIDNIIV